MKKKKILIVSIIIVLLLIASIICGVLYLKGNQKNTEEYNMAVKKYERIVYVAKKVNKEIDTKVSEAKEFINANPDVRNRQNCNREFNKYC